MGVTNSTTMLRNRTANHTSGAARRTMILKSCTDKNKLDSLSSHEIERKFEGLKEYLDANIYSATTAYNSELFLCDNPRTRSILALSKESKMNQVNNIYKPSLGNISHKILP